VSVTFSTAFPLPERSWNASGVALGDTIRAFAMSLVVPHDQAHDQALDHSWRAHLRGLLEPMREAFAQHRAATEGEEGLYADVVQDAPRLARTVDGLVAEHHTLELAMARLASITDEVSADADAVRRGARQVLDGLTRHREHDADLVYEAYGTDIGGE
jgi:hypothetical protein